MGLSLATFNVKDLFDACGPDGSGKESTAGTILTRGQLDAKLSCLTKAIAEVDADVLGLQEVGSSSVLDELCARLDRGGTYGPPIVGTPDDRGIRNALLSRVPVLDSRVHAPESLDFPVFRAGDPPPFGDRIPMRRGIVAARIDAGALGPIDVLVAHFKSNRRLFRRDASGLPEPRIQSPTAREVGEAELRSLVWRASEALFVRGLVDDLLQKSPDARIAVMGDLNDRPLSLVLRIVTGEGPGRLYSSADFVDEARRYSVLHKGKPDLFDYVLVTANLRERVLEARFHNEDLRDHGPLPDVGEPSPTPDSDHAPLVVRFRLP